MRGSGKSQYLVAEADESDRSFLKLSPILAVVTNLDREHMDCYRDMADVEAAFVTFMDRVPFYGAITACVGRCAAGGGAAARAPPRLHLRLHRRTRTSSAGCCRPGRARARALKWWPPGQVLGAFTLHVPGRHNVLNATAAVAIGTQLEIAPDCNGHRTGRVSRRGPALPIEGHGARRYGGRRLRPSSDGDPRHAGRGPRLRLQARPRASSSRTAIPAPAT